MVLWGEKNILRLNQKMNLKKLTLRLALVRPHILGIKCDNKDDREGFIHFWAVMGHMLGVEDQYNMCLFDVETVENICKILLRYFFIPVIQLETSKFKEMMNALLKGLSPFMPHMSYDIQMFLTKRLVGVPGYQYEVDLSKETICGSVFDAKELSAAKEVIRTMYRGKENYLQMYEIFFGDGIPLIAKPIANNGTVELNLEPGQRIEICGKKFRWVMGINDKSDWKDYLNDAEFYALGIWDRITIRWISFLCRIYGASSVGRSFCELGLDFILFLMKRFHSKTLSGKQTC